MPNISYRHSWIRNGDSKWFQDSESQVSEDGFRWWSSGRYHTRPLRSRWWRWFWHRSVCWWQYCLSLPWQEGDSLPHTENRKPLEKRSVSFLRGSQNCSCWPCQSKNRQGKASWWKTEKVWWNEWRWFSFSSDDITDSVNGMNDMAFLIVEFLS